MTDNVSRKLAVILLRDRPPGSVRKYARGQKCLRKCGKFGQRVGKTPPNTNNNVHIFFSLGKTKEKKRQTDKQNQQQQQQQQNRHKKQTRKKNPATRFLVTQLRVLLTNRIIQSTSNMRGDYNISALRDSFVVY